MSFAEPYFSKQKGIHCHITDEPSPTLQYAVVIPAFQEEDILPSLDSLWHCSRPTGDIEVLVVVNAPDTANEETLRINKAALKTIASWCNLHIDKHFKIFTLDATNLPVRHAGVGLARKIGMDEAVWRFNTIQKPSGLVLSFDADCLCDENYFAEIEKYYERFPQANGFNLYFEHPLSGHDFSPRIYEGIIQYELHLRYYVEGLRYSGFPYAFHTVGSCYAVKADTYVKQGGMNRKKSGEDFYFLHKIIPLGNFYEINTTRVVPSPRPSKRVPFGTGPAIQKFLQQHDEMMLTYNPQLFDLLRDFFSLSVQFYKQKPDAVNRILYNLHPALCEYLNALKFPLKMNEINSNCGSQKSFFKRFYTWFDAFAVLKFLNYASAKGFSKVHVREAATWLLHKKGKTLPVLSDTQSLLLFFREIERQGSYISPLQQL
jgi:hypothetical protein